MQSFEVMILEISLVNDCLQKQVTGLAGPGVFPSPTFLCLEAPLEYFHIFIVKLKRWKEGSLKKQEMAGVWVLSPPSFAHF